MRPYKGQILAPAHNVSGSTYISGGMLIAADVTGYYKQASDTAGMKAVRVSWSADVDNTAGSAAAQKVAGAMGLIELACDGTIDRTKIGLIACVSGTAPSYTVKLSGAASSANIPVGPIAEVSDSGKCWVLVGFDVVNPGFTSL